MVTSKPDFEAFVFTIYLSNILHICYKRIYMKNMTSPILTYASLSRVTSNTNKGKVKDLIQTFVKCKLQANSSPDVLFLFALQLQERSTASSAFHFVPCKTVTYNLICSFEFLYLYMY